MWGQHPRIFGSGGTKGSWNCRFRADFFNQSHPQEMVDLLPPRIRGTGFHARNHFHTCLWKWNIQAVPRSSHQKMWVKLLCDLPYQKSRPPAIYAIEKSPSFTGKIITFHCPFFSVHHGPQEVHLELLGCEVILVALLLQVGLYHLFSWYISNYIHRYVYHRP